MELPPAGRECSLKNRQSCVYHSNNHAYNRNGQQLETNCRQVQVQSNSLHLGPVKGAGANIRKIIITHPAQAHITTLMLQSDLNPAMENPSDLNLVQPACELGIVFTQVDNPLDKSDKPWNKSPAKEQIKNAHTDFAHIKFMDPESPQENAKDTGCYPAFATGNIHRDFSSAIQADDGIGVYRLAAVRTGNSQAAMIAVSLTALRKSLGITGLPALPIV